LNFLLIGYSTIFIFIIKITSFKFLIFKVTKIIACCVVEAVEISIVAVIRCVAMHLGWFASKSSSRHGYTCHLKSLPPELLILELVPWLVLVEVE
jgi:hypothetical protein